MAGSCNPGGAFVETPVLQKHPDLISKALEENPDKFIEVAQKAGDRAYLLSEGGFFNGCNITAIGAEKVYQIWYRAVAQYYVQAEAFTANPARFAQCECGGLVKPRPVRTERATPEQVSPRESVG